MKISLLTGASALALGACTYTPTPLPEVTFHNSAVNKSVASPVRYEDPLEGYVYRAPTGPRDWREVNEEQTEGN